MSTSQTSATKGDYTHKRLWRIKPEEEYIWSMRFYRNTEKLEKGKSESDSIKLSRAEKLEKQIKIFASFLPDEALIDIDDYSPREIECCLLYAKITGMHCLVDRHHKMKADYKIKLTNQLNSFFGALVQEILSNGGDIIKFSPTALVVIWKCTRGSYITQNVHMAIDCALVIKKHYGKFILETGEKLRVDFAITAGPIYFSFIGSKEFTKFILFGTVYEEVRKTRKASSVNNIILSPSAMQFIHSFEYILEPLDDGQYHQVIGLTKLWKQVRRNEYHDNSTHYLEMVNPSFITLNTVNTSMSRQESANNDFCLRPSVQEVMENGEMFLKEVGKFFQEGIRDALLADEPIENMLELRDVTVVTIMVATSIAKYMKKWKATDEILRTVHRCGKQYKGYVNYVSILENVTMFNVTFGLKGAAHVMQHRSALKCSFEIMNVLRDFQKVTAVTVGISTGRAYFTVIGHSLRQDLTLFGKTVLEATALSLAYSDKIVCDQDTFIHSKMKHTCFALLKEKIEDAENLPEGLIYELISDDLDLSEDPPIYDQPTLGREKEITTCENLYKKFIKKRESKENLQNAINAVYIRGYPKEGKTRLLHELIVRTPSNLPVHFITMHSGEEDIPFHFIRRFFSITFSSNLNTSTVQERQIELYKRLSDMSQNNMLWSMNRVFNVNFPETGEYWTFTSEEKLQITLHVLQHLCFKMFPVFWLILVDDADYIDDDSLGVLEPLLQTKTFFLILTKNRDYALHGSRTSTFAKSPCVKRMKLETLCPNYVSGLICQHFRVFAIPEDLEYLLQKKSNGNIGFMKNLLTNLQQRDFFKLSESSYVDIVKEHLIAPSLNLIVHITECEKENLLTFIAKKGEYDNNEFKRILWYLFVENFQNEKFYFMREKIYGIILKMEKIQICLLKKELDMNSTPEELTMNIHITQLFEMLTYQEQMILKSCSTLGDTFPRKLLEHVLTLDYYSLLAPAVKSFFEAGILCCGQGDFSDGAQYVVCREKCVDPRFNDVLSCRCKGIYISDRSRTLPDYAYCGLLRFRNSRFRENIYELLRGNQKIDIHAKVMIFVHEETKRCRSCGRDSFSWDINTKRLDDYEEAKKRKSKKERSSRILSKKMDIEMDPVQTTMHQIFYDDMLFYTKYSTSRTTSMGSHMDISLDLSFREQEIQVGTSHLFTKNRIIGPMTIAKLRHNINLVRTFSNSDFTYCDCPQILSFYHKEMMTHCRGAGQMVQLLEHMQRYAYLCILNMNISEAQHVLKQAFVCIEDIFESDKPPPKWRKNLLEAKISTISAKAYRELGLHAESVDQLKIAMEKYGLKFAKNKIKRAIASARAKLDKMLTFYMFPELHTKRLSKSICEYYNDISETLNMYAEVLMAAGKWKMAELIALKALYRALNAQTSFIRICDCFSTLITIVICRRKRSMSIALEVHALRFCYRKTNRVESAELSAVCKLYMTVFMGKLNRSELDYSIHLGYIIVRLAASLNETDKLLEISSSLVTVLLGKLFLQEAASLLLELEFCSDNIDDTSGQMWFHSQSLLFHMEVGYCIIPYQQCMSFLEIQAIESVDLKNDDGTKRLTILMWLWCLRNEHWERAARFAQYIKYCMNNLSPMTVRTVLSLLYILEGFILLIVQKLNSSNIKEARKLNDVVTALIKFIQYESKFMEVHRSKLYVLKAYYHHVRNQGKKARKWLNKADVAAKKYGIILMEEWIQHTRKAWNNELPKKKMDFWKDHCEENNVVFYQEYDMNTDDIGFFTLPTPLYM
ncbi:adenylate cyclase type 10-like [Coccinella septempunctata]|uniref:adenylate cyclase type 10-like n=1 Tax=Coccinella septempunctata TaxID=41139 RepID=UPI001D08FD61|nr:adenylate cyclase type 10-like [Coccinella septempunctata]